MYKVNFELNGIHKTCAELEAALKKEFGEKGEDGTLEYYGIWSQEDMDKMINGGWIRYTETTTQFWCEES